MAHVKEIYAGQAYLVKNHCRVWQADADNAVRESCAVSVHLVNKVPENVSVTHFLLETPIYFACHVSTHSITINSINQCTAMCVKLHS